MLTILNPPVQSGGCGKETRSSRSQCDQLHHRALHPFSAKHKHIYLHHVAQSVAPYATMTQNGVNNFTFLIILQNIGLEASLFHGQICFCSLNSIGFSICQVSSISYFTMKYFYFLTCTNSEMVTLLQSLLLLFYSATLTKTF